MSCYKTGSCGVYENRSCSECPANKPDYLARATDDSLVQKLREFGNTNLNGKMGDECVVPKTILRMSADRIEALQNAISKMKDLLKT